VEAQASLNVDFDPERKERIIAVVKDKRLFVPSTILFGAYLLPYRPLRVPDGYSVLEVQATPEFNDSEHQAQATFDFLNAPGPICRVDFETVGTACLRLEHSGDGEAFTLAQEWTSKERGGVRAPVLPDRPFRARFLRITADAPAETAVLRNIHLFALKEPSAAVCPSGSNAPELDASFKDSAWPSDAQVDGFVRVRPPAFAEAQTTVRLYRTKDALYLGAYAREPRMETMVATMTDSDSPVWEEESIEVVIETRSGSRYRFALNPLGARFDAKDRDAAWNGDWRAEAKQYTTGWAAEVALPFSVLGATPKKGEVWGFNVVRHRRNVRDERSSWAYQEGVAEEALGRLVFN
jgi:hypothetical protein